MHFAEARMGKERLKSAYVWKQLLDLGVVVATGTDYSVSPYNPFYTLHAAGKIPEHMVVKVRGDTIEQTMNHIRQVRNPPPPRRWCRGAAYGQRVCFGGDRALPAGAGGVRAHP